MSKYEYDVCVIGGLGHIGLPLAISLAETGQKVVAYDINEKAIEKVNRGEMPFLERGAEEVLKKVLNKTFFTSSDKAVVKNSRFNVVVIGTPVDRHLNPSFTVFKQFFDELVDYFHDDQHIILRSTVYPGTTEKVKRYLEERGLKTRLSFCPERIAQGYAMEELKSLPQIVSSFSREAVGEVASLFRLLTPDIVVLTPLEAELAKLFSNVWRYIQFAISNQFYQITSQHNLDFYRIYDAVVYKYPRTENLPRAGFAAGPCLFKDTMQLAAYSNNTFFLGHSAMFVNEGLPLAIIQRLKENYPLKEMNVGILGMAFKANNDDSRDSLSYKLKKILEIEAKNILCTDIYVRDAEFVGHKELIEKSEIIIVGAPHREYRELKIPVDKILVDVWNFYGKGGLF
ncbi:MAG: nucleotide sugar dehydrogenase [Vulcanimicrobiota bacterium]